MFGFCVGQGNQDNRIVIYDNKIIDYINFIMRAGDFADCTTEKVRGHVVSVVVVVGVVH